DGEFVNFRNVWRDGTVEARLPCKQVTHRERKLIPIGGNLKSNWRSQINKRVCDLRELIWRKLGEPFRPFC
ncbi:MAG: hypothetical protein ACTS7C_00455, partial [Candidatus Hodgkinia cicadicola]